MMILQGHCDEAGNDATSKVLVVAGLVSTQTRWENFEIYWRLVLRKYDVDFFHAYEFYQGKKPFRRNTQWRSELQRDIFIQELLAIVRENSRLAVIAIIDLREYSQIFERKDRVAKRVKQDVGTAYTIAGTACRWLAGLWADEEQYSEPIQFFFDAGHTHAGEFLASHDRVIQFPEIAQPHHVGGLDFEDDKVFRPLQAADLLAYGVTASLRPRLALTDADSVIRQYVGNKVRFKVVTFGRHTLQQLFDRHADLLHEQGKL